MASTSSVLGGLIALVSIASTVASVEKHFQSTTLIRQQVILRAVLRAIYRIYFHPLSKFPGPKSYAATRIPFFIAVLNGSRDRVYQDLHRKYGPIVRVYPDELSIIKPNAWKDVSRHLSSLICTSTAWDVYLAIQNPADHEYSSSANTSIYSFVLKLHNSSKHLTWTDFLLRFTDMVRKERQAPRLTKIGVNTVVQ